MKKAFTLAEVLITIGIIGVVAALTIVNLVNTYQKRVVEIKLKKFYTTINQAMRLSIAENGDPVDLNFEKRDIYTAQQNLDFLKTYIYPYLKYSKYEIEKSTSKIYTYLLDGTYFTFRKDNNGGDLVFYIKNGSTSRERFAFQFNKRKNDSQTAEMKSLTLIEPYIFNWDGTRQNLFSSSNFGCNKQNSKNGRATYCTKLIQMNNWKIPKDYPW